MDNLYRPDQAKTSPDNIVVRNNASSGWKKPVSVQTHGKKSWTMIGSLAAMMVVAFGIIIGVKSLNTAQQTRSKAVVSAVTLALTPGNKTGAIGETFSVGMTMNTDTDSVSAVELHLSYNPAALQILSFTPGTPLPVVLVPETHTNGNIKVTLGARCTNTGCTPLHGADIVGTWNVKILAARTSSITITAATQVAAIGKTTNALVSSTGSTVIGTTANSPTPTPTRAGTPTPTPTRAGTPTPTPTRAGTPTPTPTGAGTPTPTPTPTVLLGDFNNSGHIDIVDYTLFMGYWWVNNLEKADLNQDGKINAIDYTIFMNLWNESP